jgi:NAD-dependent DNA ligase
MFTKIQAPSNCPSCGSVLEWSNHLLYCRNTSCVSRVEKRIEHFSKTLKIKGLGPASIAKLNLGSINDLYQLTEEDIAEALSSDRLAEKLYSELENSKQAPLNLLLPAFSIPLVGKTAAEKLSTTCKTILDITDETCRCAGLGPKVTENLLNWLKYEYPLVKDLSFSFKFNIKNQEKVKGVVCISGKLKTFNTKGAAKLVLESKGYKVVDNLTKEVTILINESGIESTKTQRARSTGIPIVTNLLEFIGE